jgi:hypothetical protein
MGAVQSGGILLCAVDTDDRAPSLVATARAWATATGCRPVFVHGCASASAATAAAEERLAALGVREEERLLETGDAPAVIVAAADRIGPQLVLIASSANGDARLGRVAGAVLRADRTALAIVPRSAGQALSGKPVVCGVSLGHDDEAAVRFAHAFAAVAGTRLALRHVLGSRDAVLLAAERARSSVAAPPSLRTEANARAEVLAQRLLDIAREADPSVLVVASRAGDAVSVALRTDTLWSATPCPVVVVRP